MVSATITPFNLWDAYSIGAALHRHEASPASRKPAVELDQVDGVRSCLRVGCTSTSATKISKCARAYQPLSRRTRVMTDDLDGAEQPNLAPTSASRRRHPRISASLRNSGGEAGPDARERGPLAKLEPMTDIGEVHNEVGTVIGRVVQAGSIGQVVMSAPATPPIPQQLPGRVRDFAGRRQETAALRRHLPERGDGVETATVLVLHGTPGVGKSTLAIWWAHEIKYKFPDGALFADLRGFGPGSPATPGTVLSGFLAAMGVPNADVPTDTDAQAALFRSILADRRTLVLLDNAASAEQVRPLLPAAAECLVLITSRKTLHGLSVGNGAMDIPVGLFEIDEAFEFVAGIIGTEHAVRERTSVEKLVEICARLPLALRIAATRVASNRFVEVADVVREIRGGLGAFDWSGDERSAITQVFDWSYRQLTPPQARMFRLVGSHPAVEFGPHAAAALDGGGLDKVAGLLEKLADEHLLDQVGPQRYRVHDLLHTYAASRTADEYERPAALTRLLTWYAWAADAADRIAFAGQARLATTVEPVAVPLPVTTREEALEWLNVEHTTLVAVRRLAAEKGLTAAVVLLAGAARHLPLGRRSLWRDRLDAEYDGLLAARSAGNAEAETFLLVRRGNTYRIVGDYVAANADFRSVLELSGDPQRQYEALCGLGSDGRDRGRPADALPFYEAAWPVAQQTGDLLAEATVVCNLGQLHAAMGRFDLAMTFSKQELALRGKAGDEIGVAYAQTNVAIAYQGLGNDTIAIELCERSLAVDGVATADRVTTLKIMSASLTRVGRTSAASRCLHEAAELLTLLSDERATELRQQAYELETRRAAG
ncbi:ATP-binding protein [Lentzea sp. NPDC059081]|uniref:ATP-binding protein n=1 Tax=Lentzea sp. NPDC059081 TaxID=3346719 RepID=UPI0036C643BE